MDLVDSAREADEQEHTHDLALVGTRPGSQVQSMAQEFFDSKEPNKSINLVKQWNVVLQYRAQSSQ